MPCPPLKDEGWRVKGVVLNLNHCQIITLYSLLEETDLTCVWCTTAMRNLKITT